MLPAVPRPFRGSVPRLVEAVFTFVDRRRGGPLRVVATIVVDYGYGCGYGHSQPGEELYVPHASVPASPVPLVPAQSTSALVVPVACSFRAICSGILCNILRTQSCWRATRAMIYLVSIVERCKSSAA